MSVEGAQNLAEHLQENMHEFTRVWAHSYLLDGFPGRSEGDYCSQ